jgi:2,4-dienoyl-CoA reductase-like NADH-dependent reductase (Old Yellow Enzyme family)
MDPRHAVLFEPVPIGPKTLPNRFYQVPHASGFGSARPRTQAAFRGIKAEGGWGGVCTDYAPVSADSDETPEVGSDAWNLEAVRRLGIVADAIHEHGALAGIELHHGGAEATNGESRYPRLAPSQASSVSTYGGLAKTMTTADIRRVRADFVTAARRARDVGFDIVYVYGAHGYLMTQMLSPVTNQRVDAYGGSLENRARLLLEVVRAVRTAVGDTLPVLVRFSATDWADDGWDADQTSTVAAWAQEAGVDFFDISTGGLVGGVSIPLGPGYQVPFAEQIGADADAPVSAVGLITTPQQADAVIREGRADAVMLGRELLRDPHFPLRAAHELGADLAYWPPQYLRARPR